QDYCFFEGAGAFCGAAFVFSAGPGAPSVEGAVWPGGWGVLFSTAFFAASCAAMFRRALSTEALCDERQARVSEVSMKMIAHPVVTLLRKVTDPRPPKTVFDDPPPPAKAAMASPFPGCKRMTKKGAARQDDLGIHAVCCGPNNFTVVKGSPTVYVNGKPFARMNDKTKHCGGSGPITEGSPNVYIDDGADAAGLGQYLINALKILLEQALESKKKQAKKASDTHQGAEDPGARKNVSKDAKDERKSGSIRSARCSRQRAANGQDVELRIECKDPKGQLQIEIWAQSADRAQDKKVKSESAGAAKSVKKKVKLE